MADNLLKAVAQMANGLNHLNNPHAKKGFGLLKGILEEGGFHAPVSSVVTNSLFNNLPPKPAGTVVPDTATQEESTASKPHF